MYKIFTTDSSTHCPSDLHQLATVLSVFNCINAYTTCTECTKKCWSTLKHYISRKYGSKRVKKSKDMIIVCLHDIQCHM